LYSLKKSYSQYLSILCALIVPLLVSGPFLPDLMITIMSLWFLYFSLKNKIYTIYLNPYFCVFIAFCAICILSSLFSENILLSLKASLFYCRIGVFALLISYLIDCNKKILVYFYYAFFITFLALVIDGYVQFFTGTNLFGHEILENRISSFFGDELVLGSYLARLFPLFFALFVAKKNKHLFEVWGIFILFLLVDVLIFIAGERASFFFLNLSTVFIILFISQYKWLRLGVFVLSLFVITLLTFNNTKLYDRYIQSPIQSMGFDNENSNKQMFTAEHDSVIRTGWKMFLDKPILGHGPKMYRIKCKDPKYATGITPCHNHPHNFYIQLLAETGMAGFSFLAGLFFYFCYLIIRHILEYFKNSRFLFNDYQICLLAGLLITIWPLTTNGNFFTNHLMLFYSLQMGFFRKNI